VSDLYTYSHDRPAYFAAEIPRFGTIHHGIALCII